MKRTVSGTIGHRGFQVEEDAWQEITSYLDSLRGIYAQEKDCEEIIRDIEDRIGEHLWEWRGAQGQVIGIADVQRVIGLVGAPQDLSGDSKRTNSSRVNPTPRKKLYRDPDNRVLGGICSGLSYYFNTDVVVIRILAAATLFLGLAGFWIYIIMWLITPKANTRTQKLEMRGVPVTPENLNDLR